MRFTFETTWCSLDVVLFEAPAEDEPNIRAVAGSPWPADSTIAPSVDALAQIDEQPEDRRRTGFTA